MPNSFDHRSWFICASIENLWSSGLLKSSEGLVLGTDIWTTHAEAIVRVKSSELEIKKPWWLWRWLILSGCQNGSPQKQSFSGLQSHRWSFLMKVLLWLLGSNHFFKDYMWLHFQSRQFLNFIDVKLKSMFSILACLVLEVWINCQWTYFEWS